MFFKPDQPKFLFCLAVILLMGLVYVPARTFSQINFQKQMIASESSESVSVFDVNNDGILDIVSGGFWYEGPDFIDRHWIGEVDRSGPDGQYWDEFAVIPMDVNGDGYTDYISGDWFSKSIWWRENPGKKNIKWKKHLIDECGNVEAIGKWDFDGDGIPEIVPNLPNDGVVIFRLKLGENGKGSGSFEKMEISQEKSHGLGFGDINNDGRTDIIISSGWLEAPKDLFSEKWEYHSGFNFGTAGIPILFNSFKGDGSKQLIVGQGHNYGLSYFDVNNAKDNNDLQLVEKTMDLYGSQYHTMEAVDIDNDGNLEIVTGKRFRAHNGNDPGSNDTIGLFIFKWVKNKFEKYPVSAGRLGAGKGTGLQFFVGDINNNGFKDIVVAGKDGLIVFYNLGK